MSDRLLDKIDLSIWFQLRYSIPAVFRHRVAKNYITTAIRLRYDYYLSDYDVSRAPASIRREQKMNMSIFRLSRVVVESQL